MRRKKGEEEGKEEEGKEEEDGEEGKGKGGGGRGSQPETPQPESSSQMLAHTIESLHEFLNIAVPSLSIKWGIRPSSCSKILKNS